MAKTYNHSLDLNYRPVMTGNSFSTQDISGTPKVSPLAYSSTEIAIAVPANAVMLLLTPSTALRISEITGMARYYTLSANSSVGLWVAGLANSGGSLYIKRDSADWTLNFMFVTL